MGRETGCRGTQRARGVVALLLSGMLAIGGLPAQALAEAAGPDGGEAATRESGIAEKPAEPVPLTAQATTQQGTWGTCSWTFDGSTGELVIAPAEGTEGTRGSGSNAPWKGLTVRSVRVEPGVRSGTSLRGMFGMQRELVSADLSGLSTQGCEDMSVMFYWCDKLESVTFGGGWDTSKVEDFIQMFEFCQSLRTVATGTWSLRSARFLGLMFDDCKSLESVALTDVGGLARPAGHYGLNAMLADCTSLREADLSGIDTCGYTPSTGGVFSNCTSLETLKLGAGYEASKDQDGLLPAPTSDTGKWWSATQGAWLSNDEIATRGPMADTLCSAERAQTAKANISTATIFVAGWTYDGASHDVVPTVTLGGETLTKGTDYSVSGATSVTDAGTYTMTVTGTGDYEGTASALFTVARRAATVTADDKTKVAGEDDPELTASVEGTLGEDSLEYALSREAGDAEGTYEIVPAGATEQGNYAVTYAKGTFTITTARPPYEGTVLEELRNDVRTARKAYDEAVAQTGGMDLVAAQQRLSNAQKAYTAAETALNGARQANDAAQSELSGAQTASEQAATALKAAQDEKEAAASEQSRAGEELKAAQDAQAQADALSTHEAQVAEAQKRVEQATSAKKSADLSVASYDYRTDLWRSYLDAAKEQVRAAQATKEDAALALQNHSTGPWDLTKYNTARGSLGFFEYVNEPVTDERYYEGDSDRRNPFVYEYNSSDSAIAELTGEDYTYKCTTRSGTEQKTLTPASTKQLKTGRTVLSYTTLGAEKDATSLENMKFSLEIARLCNAYRKKSNETYGLTTHGQAVENEYGEQWHYLEPIQLSDYLMAHTQTHINVSSVTRKHAANDGAYPLHNGSEILAWGYTNPFIAWYTQERDVWLAHVGDPNVDMRYYDAETYDPWYNYDFYKAVGHYLAVVSGQGDYVLVGGAAYNDNKATSGMVFTTDTNDYLYEAPILSRHYTVEDYYVRFMRYYNAVKAAEAGNASNVEQSVYDRAAADLADAQKALTEAQSNVQKYGDSYREALVKQEAAQKELTDAQEQLFLVEAGNSLPDVDPVAVRERLNAAQEACAAAEERVSRATSALRDATDANDNAQARLNKARTDAAKAQSNLNDTQGAFDAAKGELEQATAQHALAQTQSQAILAQTKALEDAQRALDEATNISRAEVTGLEDATYDGTAKTQGGATLRITVSKGDRSEEYVLSQDDAGETGITASYSENVGAGTAGVTFSAAGTKGSGTFWGTKEASFKIALANLSGAAVSGIASQTYTGKALAPKPTVTMGGRVLAEGTDYALSYANNVSAGTATVTVAGRGNYAGTNSATFAIERARVAVPAAANRTYDGTAQAGVAAGAGYALSGTWRATDAGTYAATATPDANHRWADGSVGARSVSWRIAPASIAGASVSAIGAQTHTGRAICPRPTVRLGSKTLREGADYALSYRNNVNVGTATVTVTGRGNYAGTKSATFQVKSPVTSLAGAAVSAIGTQAYTGRAVCPQPTVRVAGRTLRLGADYALAYRNNVGAGTATVVVTGRGSYAGTKSATFRIVAPSVSYRTHVQNDGWQGWRSDGRMSGTSGRGLRLEGINIKVGSTPASGGIQYRTHIQNIGWQGWRSNGAMSGTSGRGLRLEAIEIRLTGQMAKLYDVYYRVHAQNVGWMGWAKNGVRSGTAGFGYRLEGIQVVLVPKGQPAPAATYLGIRQASSHPFRQR